jgi:hypothetical protein
MSTQILRFFVNTCLLKLSLVLKRPNSRACALETTASFLATSDSVYPRAFEGRERPWKRGWQHHGSEVYINLERPKREAKETGNGRAIGRRPSPFLLFLSARSDTKLPGVYRNFVF